MTEKTLQTEDITDLAIEIVRLDARIRRLKSALVVISHCPGIHEAALIARTTLTADGLAEKGELSNAEWR